VYCADFKDDTERLLVDVYGLLMFTSAAAFTFYIGMSLTELYPLVQSLRDDVAFDALETYSTRWGGYELYLFNIGFQCILFAMLVVSRVMYSGYVVWVQIGVFFVCYA